MDLWFWNNNTTSAAAVAEEDSPASKYQQRPDIFPLSPKQSVSRRVKITKKTSNPRRNYKIFKANKQSTTKSEAKKQQEVKYAALSSSPVQYTIKTHKSDDENCCIVAQTVRKDASPLQAYSTIPSCILLPYNDIVHYFKARRSKIKLLHPTACLWKTSSVLILCHNKLVCLNSQNCRHNRMNNSTVSWEKEFVSSLDEQGVLLVSTIKQKGAGFRQLNREFKLSAKKIITQELNELNQNVVERFQSASKQKLIHLLEILNNLYLNFSRETEASAVAVLKDFLHSQENLKVHVSQKRKQLDGLKENPPGLSEVVKQVEEFQALLLALSQHMKKLGLSATIPWQLQQCNTFDPDSSAEKTAAATISSQTGEEDDEKFVSFDLGRPIDEEGYSIYGSYCYNCDIEIQDGSYNEGVKRYHCLDCKNVPRSRDMCSNCYELKQIEFKSKVVAPLRQCLYSSNELSQTASHMLELIRQHDGHLLLEHVMTEETNVDVFLKWKVTDATNIAYSLHNALLSYGSRPCFGRFSSTKGYYEWSSYEQVRLQTVKFAIQLKELLAAQTSTTTACTSSESSSAEEMTFVGICTSTNRPEWLIADFANTMNDFVTVGIHFEWPLQDIQQIAKDTKMQCMICDAHMLRELTPLLQNSSPLYCPSLKYLVCIDPLLGVTIETSLEERVLDFQEMVQKTLPDTKSTVWGITVTSSIMLEPPAAYCSYQSKNDLFSLIYSSGTEGHLKGIMIDKEAYREDNVKYVNYNLPNIVMSYASLGHGMDRGLCWQTISNGGRVAFVEEPFKLYERIQAANPFCFVAMPHVWTKLYADFLVEKESSVDALEKYSKKLGSNIQVIASGGSPISPQVFEFLRTCFKQCSVIDTYGLTEVSGISSNGVIRSGVELKLLDAPEIGYTNQDKPHPRGEILVKTSTQTKQGYFKLPEQTSQLFTEDGFIRTGDIGLIDEQGHLHIIDRRKNLVEIDINGWNIYVETGNLESKFKECQKIHQIWITGDRIQSALIAVVVVSNDLGDVSKLSEEEQVQLKEQIQSELQCTIAPKYSLEDHCVPKGIVLVPFSAQWTSENGLLTLSGKNKRGALLRKYKHQVDLEYARINKKKKE